MKEIFKIDFLKNFRWSENIKELILLSVTIVLLALVMSSFRGDVVGELDKGEVASRTIKAPQSFILREKGKKQVSDLKGHVIVREGDVVNIQAAKKIYKIR